MDHMERFASVAEEMQSLSISPHSSAPLGMSYLSILLDNTFECIPGLSRTWQAIVEHLCDHQINRLLTIFSGERRKLILKGLLKRKMAED